MIQASKKLMSLKELKAHLIKSSNVTWRYSKHAPKLSGSSWTNLSRKLNKLWMRTKKSLIVKSQLKWTNFWINKKAILNEDLASLTSSLTTLILQLYSPQVAMILNQILRAMISNLASM